MGGDDESAFKKTNDVGGIYLNPQAMTFEQRGEEIKFNRSSADESMESMSADSIRGIFPEIFRIVPAHLAEFAGSR